MWTRIAPQDAHRRFRPLVMFLCAFAGLECALGLPVLAAADGDWFSHGVAPSPRLGAATAYDPVRNQMIIFGGASYLDDVWALSLSGAPVWQRIEAAGTPPPLYGSTAVYDRVADRLIVFGGWADVFRNDVYELTLSGTPTWRRLTTLGAGPSGRGYHVAVVDEFRHRLVVFVLHLDDGLARRALANIIDGPIALDHHQVEHGRNLCLSAGPQAKRKQYSKYAHEGLRCSLCHVHKGKPRTYSTTAPSRHSDPPPGSPATYLTPAPAPVH